MLSPIDDDKRPPEHASEPVWSVYRASEEIEGEIVLTRLVEAQFTVGSQLGSVVFSLQLYEMPSGSRRVRLWIDDDKKSIPYDGFINAIRRAAEDLGWEDDQSKPTASPGL